MLYRCVFFIVCSFSLSVHANNTFKVASDEWCPYICYEENKPGILIEILNEIAKNDGFKIQFDFIPLARSLRLLQQSKLDMVLALTDDHIKEFNLKQSQQVYGGWYNDFYVRKSTQWKFTSIENLKLFIEQGNTLGLINAYEYGKGIDQLKESSGRYIYTATGNTPLPNLLKMLSKRRIAVLLDSRFNVEYEIKDNNIKNLQHVGTDGGFVPLYIGYAPKTSKKHINALDKGLVKLRATGQLSNILKRYGVPDWKQ